MLDGVGVGVCKAGTAKRADYRLRLLYQAVGEKDIFLMGADNVWGCSEWVEVGGGRADGSIGGWQRQMGVIVGHREWWRYGRDRKDMLYGEDKNIFRYTWTVNFPSSELTFPGLPRPKSCDQIGHECVYIISHDVVREK